MNILLYIVLGCATLVFFGLLLWGILSLIPHRFLPNRKGWKNWGSGVDILSKEEKEEHLKQLKTHLPETYEKLTKEKPWLLR